MVQILAKETLLYFEVAAHNAFHAAYRNTSISKEGLKHRFENDKEFPMMVRSLSALAFVPPNQVGNVFNQLSDAFPGEDDKDYIRNRGCLCKVRPTRYPAVTSNHTHQALYCLPKTTNCVEGFHNTLMHGLLKQ